MKKHTLKILAILSLVTIVPLMGSYPTHSRDNGERDRGIPYWGGHDNDHHDRADMNRDPDMNR